MNLRRSGFALPTVLIASVVMLTVLLASVASTAAIRASMTTQYYNSLTQTASEAGVNYAKSCLAASNGIPTWSDAKPLKPDTDCNGDTLGSCPSDPNNACHFVSVNGSTKSSFSIGMPTVDSSGKADNLNSVGQVNLIRTSSGSTWRQLNQTLTVKVSGNTIKAYLWGGGGAGGTIGGWSDTGGGIGGAGGAGGAAQGTLSGTPGASYTIVVGGGGKVNSYNYGSVTCANGGGGCASWNNADNRYGGGGGGYSGIFNGNGITQATALLVAGGGGGGGTSRLKTDVNNNAGGAGGGSVGQDGFSPYGGVTYAGKGGTQSAAGADAANQSTNTTGGQGALQGGRAKMQCYGGAGGGGYWGGSAGGYSESNTMAGGGGGSSYYNASLVSSAALNGGNGTTPGDSSNAYRGFAGNAGIANTTTIVAAATNGSNGKVVITYPTGSVSATGGTITYSGGNTIHTFNSDGVFRIAVGTVKALVVGGGGSGGARVGAGGGGGAVQYNGFLQVGPVGYKVTVGNGGASAVSTNATPASGNDGGNSSIGSLLTAAGGGGGGAYTTPANGRNGGNGGGAGGYTTGIGGIGLQGFAGGTPTNGGAGGGGGAGGVGGNAVTTTGGNGGNGVANSISGTSVYYGAGGGGSGDVTAGSGGSGVGGSGNSYSIASQISTGSVPVLMCISSDDSSVYIVNNSSNTISMYNRDKSKGYLSYIGFIATGAAPNGIAISPDGTSVYVTDTALNKISLYNRNTLNGQLTENGTVDTGTGPYGIAISPDGTSVYVTNNGATSISLFNRNTSTGALTANGTAITGSNTYGIAISNDGTSVYAASWGNSSVYIYNRNTSTGALTANGTIAAGTNTYDVVVSPDNLNVYTTNSGSSNVSIFNRNISTGALIANGTVATRTSPRVIKSSPDGNFLYVVHYGENFVNIYSRNKSNNGYLSLFSNTVATGSNPTGGVVSYDGKSYYVGNYGSNSITMYSIDSSSGNLYLISNSAVSGRSNTGSGGGGVRNIADSGTHNSGAGGSGVVIISYPTGSMTATGGVITYTDSNNLNPRSSPSYAGGYTIHTFTSDGIFTPIANGFSCPTGFVIAPGSETYGTSNFCVAKYETKIQGNDNGSQTYNSAFAPESRASGTPWTNVTEVNALAESITACNGCHLITEAEWMTVAQNAVQMPINWNNVAVGSGYVYSGHNDGSPAATLAAAADNDPYNGTGNTSGNQRRTLTLSNGEVIWDMAGNVWEWTDGSVNANTQMGISGEGTYSWKEWNNASLSQHDFLFNSIPYSSKLANITWNSSSGVGQLYSYYNEGTPHNIHRGGDYASNSTAGIYSLSIYGTNSTFYTNVGFRMAK